MLTQGSSTCFTAGADARGVVVAAFGSLLSAKPQAMLAIAYALAALRQTVLWKVVPADIGDALQAEFDEVVGGMAQPFSLRQDRPSLPQSWRSAYRRPAVLHCFFAASPDHMLL